MVVIDSYNKKLIQGGAGMSRSKIAKLEQRVKELEAALVEAERVALIDSLTGILNRCGLDTEIERTLAQSMRQGTSFSVLFIDLDQFKAINDTHGHDIGDQVLKEVADFLKKTVRTSDIVARQSGDEFVIILPASDLLVAQYVAGKIRKEITGKYFASKSCVGLTVGLSIGAASTSEGVREFSKLRTLADARMYKEKASDARRI